MIARAHTEHMLDWWIRAGISHVDMAVRRRDGTMIWHHEIRIDRIPLRWARAENTRGSDIYIRPAAMHAWPVVFLDDVPASEATRIARKYRALPIRTSPAGGCHIWITCSRTLTVSERAVAQRWMANRCGADPASTSGEHLGRLAGFKNWKRGGCWVNTAGTFPGSLAWDPSPSSVAQPTGPTSHDACRVTSRVMDRTGTDRSESGCEWGWICGRLESGDDPARLVALLRERARSRRGQDAERYARRTVLHAMRKTGRQLDRQIA